MSIFCLPRRVFLASLLSLMLPVTVPGQLAERPSGSTAQPGDPPKDLTGDTIRYPRVRAVHSADPNQEGTSAYFIYRDPYLAYQRGRILTQREFRPRDGVFGDISGFAGALPDGFTPLITRDNQTNCGGCHNMPYREAGAGTNFAKSGAGGRNSPHFFGGGLVEMVAQQTRLKMLDLVDADRNGWVSVEEMQGQSFDVIPAPGADPINYGTNADEDSDGRPDLNPIMLVWYVDELGRKLKGARSLNDVNVVGYNFSMVIWGWGEPGKGLNPTNRVFYHDPINTHTGLQAFDPTSQNDPDEDGITGPSIVGAYQFTSHLPLDKGQVQNDAGVSLDDPDRDGCFEEITEGDLDLAEFYMLNAPRPATGAQTVRVLAGKELFTSIGCAECHTPDWKLEAGDLDNPEPHKRYTGDRRVFDLAAAWNDETGRLEGTLVPLGQWVEDPAAQGRQNYVPLAGEYLIEGIYSDFKHHEMGKEFYQILFDGSVQKMWRTAPLWGVGSTAPYAHDGANFDLDSVTRRHGGEALDSRQAYEALTDEQRISIQEFLRSLKLYNPDRIPCDIDGDGEISENFMLAGQDVGIETFNAEYLFNTPPQYEGMIVAADGSETYSRAVLNIAEAFGTNLEYIADADLDGFPDMRDIRPFEAGYMDGWRSVRYDLNQDKVFDAADARQLIDQLLKGE